VRVSVPREILNGSYRRFYFSPVSFDASAHRGAGGESDPRQESPIWNRVESSLGDVREKQTRHDPSDRRIIGAIVRNYARLSRARGANRGLASRVHRQK